MPVTYEIDASRELIHTRCRGYVTFEEVLGHFDTLEHDPQRPDRLYVLLDLSELRSVPESDQLRVVAARVGSARAHVQFDACAIVATRDVLYGMSRVFEVFAQEHFAATHVFREIEQAEHWLREIRQPAAP